MEFPEPIHKCKDDKEHDWKQKKDSMKRECKTCDYTQIVVK